MVTWCEVKSRSDLWVSCVHFQAAEGDCGREQRRVEEGGGGLGRPIAQTHSHAGSPIGLVAECIQLASLSKFVPKLNPLAVSCRTFYGRKLSLPLPCLPCFSPSFLHLPHVHFCPTFRTHLGGEGGLRHKAIPRPTGTRTPCVARRPWPRSTCAAPAALGIRRRWPGGGSGKGEGSGEPKKMVGSTVGSLSCWMDLPIGTSRGTFHFHSFQGSESF